jgi:hypothetical protein
MATYVNSARHALTLPDGRTVPAGEAFQSWDDLSGWHLAGHLIDVDAQPAPQPVAPSQVPDAAVLGQSAIVPTPPADEPAEVEPEPEHETTSRPRTRRRRGEETK